MPTSSFIKTAIILGGLSASSCFANAIAIVSSATETTNNTASATVNIPANPAWAPAFAGTNWVSYTQSGDPGAAGYTQVANGTSVIFTDTFTVTGTPSFGTLIAMADDTTSVTLNGVLLANFAPTAGNKYTTCSDFSIGCTTATTGVISLTNALKSGTNTLSFDVLQIAGSSFGLDYSGIIVSSATPEPGTLALFGLPLVALALIRVKRT